MICCFLLFQASLIDIIVYQPNEYGKGFIKPFKIHPDTYVQMAIQLAYYKVHGKYVLSYLAWQIDVEVFNNCSYSC